MPGNGACICTTERSHLFPHCCPAGASPRRSLSAVVCLQPQLCSLGTRRCDSVPLCSHLSVLWWAFREHCIQAVCNFAASWMCCITLNGLGVIKCVICILHLCVQGSLSFVLIPKQKACDFAAMNATGKCLHTNTQTVCVQASSYPKQTG